MEQAMELSVLLIAEAAVVLDDLSRAIEGLLCLLGITGGIGQARASSPLLSRGGIQVIDATPSRELTDRRPIRPLIADNGPLVNENGALLQ